LLTNLGFSVDADTIETIANCFQNNITLQELHISEAKSLVSKEVYGILLNSKKLKEY
jgi:hypothetical protein